MKRTTLVIPLLLLAVATALPAQAALQDVGPVSADNGFPVWYEDTNNLRLDLCLDQNGFCLTAEPDPGQPIAFPANFGDEAFWWNAVAFATGTGLSTGLDGQVDLAMEAAFANFGAAAPGQQIAFGRIRIRVNVPVAGSYTLTHPYGTITFPNVTVADGIDVTQDIGNFATPAANFAAALADDPGQAGLVSADGRNIGPFLTRADAQVVVDPGTGNTYIGNPNQAVAVTGSPLGTNFFRIEGPDGILAETTQFFLMGKVSGCDPANTAPVAVADTAVSRTATAVTISVLANDTDNTAVNPASVVIASQATSGTAVANADGTVTYTPNAGFDGADSFTYTVQDFCGLTSGAATVTIEVENLQTATSDYRARTGRWTISGTTSHLVDLVPQPNVITLRVGSASGPIIGTAQVQGDNTWSFSGKASVSPGQAPHRIHAQSGLGVSMTQSLRIR